MSQASSKSTPKTSQVAELFVVGLDKSGRHRGARFFSATEQTVKAAAESGYHVAERPPLGFAELAMDLPLGQIDGAGRLSVPVIKPELYRTIAWAFRQVDQLRQAEAAGYPSPRLLSPVAVPEDQMELPLPTYPAKPREWLAVDVGCQVLLHGGPEIGWWDAIVVDRADDILKLRLRDDPERGVFYRHRNAVALINPGLV